MVILMSKETTMYISLMLKNVSHYHQKQKQQETLFDTNSDFQDAFNKITEPVDNKVTNEDVAQYLSEELGHLYGADTALEMCRQIVDGRATVTITHRYDEKTAKGTAHYAISGEVELP